MRIGGLPPVPSGRPKEGRKSAASPNLSQDQFINQTKDSIVSYSAPKHQVIQDDEAHLQMKNYVTTVLLRQNWVQKTSRLNAHVMRSRDKLEFPDSTYWQPEQAAKRILSFAQTLGGDDAAQIESLQASVLTGIDETIKLLGGETQSAQVTKEHVLNLFKEWKSILLPTPSTDNT